MSIDNRKTEISEGTEKLIENRKAYYSKHSEFSIYSTNQPANVQLRFSNPIICKMLKGKKEMTLPGAPPFFYLPGESLFVQSNMLMDISFPEADIDNPTECMCVEIETGRINNILEQLNENKATSLENGEWKLQQSKFAHLKQEQDIDHLIDKLASIFTSDNSEFRDLMIDITLSELVVRVLQHNSRELLVKDCKQHASYNGLAAAIQYINENPCKNICMDRLSRIACMSKASLYRNFKLELGITPAQYVNRIKIKHACEMLMEHNYSVTKVCYELGYGNVGHFAKRFRKLVGVTPKKYQQDILQTRHQNDVSYQL